MLGCINKYIVMTKVVILARFHHHRASVQVALLTLPFMLLVLSCKNWWQGEDGRHHYEVATKEEFYQLQTSEILNSRTNQTKNIITRFEPELVLEQYQQWHSVEVLQRELPEQRNARSYAIGYLFPCAARAGNQFHNFYNSLLWSVITNRTMLVAYDSPSQSLCAGQPKVPLAPWIPLWEDWNEALFGTWDDNVGIDDQIENIPLDTARERYDHSKKLVRFPQIVDIVHANIAFSAEWSDHPLKNVNGARYIANMGMWHKKITTALYREGADFMMGMMFRYCFTSLDNDNLYSDDALNDDGDDNNDEVKGTKHSDDSTFSLALHSRHTLKEDTGSSVQKEVDCLIKLLSEKRDSDACSVCLMSDRNLTVYLLSDWLLKHNCTPIMSFQNAKLQQKSQFLGGGGITEHGERPGGGFLSDLGLCSQARSGVIGDDHRSSFMLLLELVEYDRRQSQPNGNPIPELMRCSLTSE